MDMTSTASTLRDVMAGAATPIAVVTAMDGERPHGTTVSAFASRSLDPPMIMVAPDRGSDPLAVVPNSRRFGVNALGSGQARLAPTSARRGTDKFAAVPYSARDGLPRRIDQAVSWPACEVGEFVDGGDHVIALGHLTAAETEGGSPLTYHARVLGTDTKLKTT